MIVTALLMFANLIDSCTSEKVGVEGALAVEITLAGHFVTAAGKIIIVKMRKSSASLATATQLAQKIFNVPRTDDATAKKV